MEGAAEDAASVLRMLVKEEVANNYSNFTGYTATNGTVPHDATPSNETFYSDSYLTDTQEIVLALLPIPSALLSIMGSLVLLRLVVRAKFRRPYRRILFGMSCYDILNSITVCLQTFLVPSHSSRRLLAIGNDCSCQALGFLFQVSYPSFCYFGVLSIYYVLAVKWSITDAFFARNIEPFLHAVTLLWPITTAILGLRLGLYGEVSIGAGCWISEQAIQSKDSVCRDVECIEKWTWIMGGLPFMLVFAMVIVNNLLVYCHVRTTIFRVTRNQRRSSNGSSSLRPESQEAKVRAVGAQALLYCGVFLLTYCWTIVLRLASNEGDGPPQEPHLFPIMVLRAIFLPAMGLGTVLVYTRPRYVMMRKGPEYKHKGRWWTLRQVLWDDEMAGRSSATHVNLNGASSVFPLGAGNRMRSLFQMPSGDSLRSAFFTSKDSNDAMPVLSPIQEETQNIAACGKHHAQQQGEEETESPSAHPTRGIGVVVGVGEAKTEGGDGCMLEVPDLTSSAEVDLELAEYEVVTKD